MNLTTILLQGLKRVWHHCFSVATIWKHS